MLEVYDIKCTDTPPFFLYPPLNWIQSILFLAVPAAQVMWQHICFTPTGPFYIIHYAQPRCQPLIRANPALFWRAALTNLAAAFSAHIWDDCWPTRQHVVPWGGQARACTATSLHPPWLQPSRARLRQEAMGCAAGLAPQPSVCGGYSDTNRCGTWQR